MTLLDSIKNFDLKNSNLSGLFAEIAIDLYNLSCEKYLNKINYENIICASEILKNKSREFRLGKVNIFIDDLFFYNFYEEEDKKDKNIARKLYANRLLILSENLSTIKDLPKEKINELSGILTKLSEKTREYWNINNPNGFKK